MVYLIHFERPIGSEKKQAQHYLGYAKTLSSRVKRHKEGRGAAILRACNEQKIGWAVVRTWPEGDRRWSDN